MINIEIRKDVIAQGPDDDKLIAQTKRYIASRLKNKNITLEIDYVSPEYITELNLRFRGQNNETDVLSFPIYRSIKDIINQERIYLGNIVLNIKGIKKDSFLLKKNLTDNCILLVRHSIDHLLGNHHK